MNRGAAVFLIMCALGAAGVVMTRAGDLTPPAGAPAPTFKTLDEVEPSTPLTQDTTPGDATAVFRITEPGAYHLVDEVITLGPGTVGIAIESDDVTLDLRGFRLAGGTGGGFGGAAPEGGPNFGIDAQGRESVVIRNGIITGSWDAGVEATGGEQIVVEDVLFADALSGVRLATGRVSRCEFRNVNRGVVASGAAVVEQCNFDASDLQAITLGENSRVTECTMDECGINAADFTAVIEVGDDSIVSDCAIRESLHTGVRTGARSIVRDTVFRRNNQGFFSGAGPGIETGIQSLVSGCVVAGTFDQGILVFFASRVENCIVSGTNGNGIEVVLACEVIGCEVDNVNTGDGIHGLGGDTIVDCQVTGAADDGIEIVDRGGVVSRCTVRNNAGAGVRVGETGTVTECSAYNNEDGYFLGDGSRLSNSTASDSQNIGVVASTRCTVENNTCANNEVGILVSGEGSRIDGNHVTGSQLDGISIRQQMNNMVVRNTASSNSPNYNIGPGNQVGTIQTGTTASNAVPGAGAWDNFEW